MLNKIRLLLPDLHFYVIALCILLQALTFGEMYRAFAYINIILVLIGLRFYPQGNNFHKKVLLAGITVLVGLAIWDGLVSSEFSVTVKPLRHLLLALGLLAGVTLLSVYHEKMKPRFMMVLTSLVYGYTIFQFVAVYIANRPYGTTKNPHYLAIYSAIFLAISVYLIFKQRVFLHRCLLGLSAFVLGTLLLFTSSRPIWIALLLAVLFLILCLQRRTALKLLIGTTLLFGALTITNVGNFQARWEDLILNANTEERVTIWQDTWQMQLHSSSRSQWLFGHGFDSFEKDFPGYSRYHFKEHIDFNSPHNIFLELLYQFGVAGVALMLFAVVFLYYKIISAYRECRNHSHYAWVYLLLLLVLTIDFFSVSIILPFFVGINVNLLALVTAVTLYLKSIETH